jgi:hypothetical protein
LLQARYANYFEVGHSDSEVVLVFGQAYELEGDAAIHTRLVTSPAGAKELSRILEKSLVDYERAHGPIRES